MNARRCDLIDKDIQRTIRDDQRHELEMLTDQFRQFRRQTAPLQIEGALRLHAELLKKNVAITRIEGDVSQYRKWFT